MALTLANPTVRMGRCRHTHPVPVKMSEVELNSILVTTGDHGIFTIKQFWDDLVLQGGEERLIPEGFSSPLLPVWAILTYSS